MSPVANTGVIAQHRRVYRHVRQSRWAALVAAAGLCGPVQAATPTSDAAEEATQSREARDRYASGDFVAAARMYEALQRSTGAAKYHFNAGMAREAAGHRAHALIHWRRYLAQAVGVPAEESSRLRAQISEAERLTAVVRLTTREAGDWTLRMVGADESEELTITVAGAAELRLDPGIWTASREAESVRFTVDLGQATEVALPEAKASVAPDPVPPPVRPPRELWINFSPPSVLRIGVEISYPGRKPVKVHRPLRITAPPIQGTLQARSRGYLPRSVELGPDTPSPLALRLAPDRLYRARVGLAVGLGGVSVAAIVTGIALTIDGGRTYGGAGDLSSESGSTRALAGTQRQASGLMALGVGVGSATAAASSWGRPRLVALEVALGAAGTLGGAIAVPLLRRRYDSDAQAQVARDPTWAPDRSFFAAHRGGEFAMAAVLGAGAALLVGAATNWAVRGVLGRRARATGWAPAGAPGVGWSGHF